MCSCDCSSTDLSCILSLLSRNKEMRNTLQLEEVFQELDTVIGVQFAFVYEGIDTKINVSIKSLSKSLLSSDFESEIKYRATTEVVTAENIEKGRRRIYRLSSCESEQESRFDWELSDLQDIRYECVGRRRFKRSDAVILDEVPLILS